MSPHHSCHKFTPLIMIISLCILFSHHIKSFNCILFNIHPHHDYEKPIWPRNWQLFHLQKMDFGDHHHEDEYLHEKPHHFKHIHHHEHRHRDDHDDEQEETHKEEVIPVYKHYHDFDVEHYEKKKHDDHGKHKVHEHHGKHHPKPHVVIKHHHPAPVIVTHVLPKPKHVIHHHHHPYHPPPKKSTKTTHHHHHHHHEPETKHKVIEVEKPIVIKTYKTDKNSHKDYHEDVKDKHEEAGHSDDGDKHKEDDDKKKKEPETYEKVFVHEEKHEEEIAKPEDHGKDDDKHKHEEHHVEDHGKEEPKGYQKQSHKDSHEEHNDGGGKGGKGKKVTHVYEKKHEKVEKKENPFPHIIQMFDYQHVQKEDDKHDDGQYHDHGKEEEEIHKEEAPKHDPPHDDKHGGDKGHHDGGGHEDVSKHAPDFDRKKKKYSMNHETNEGKKYEFNRNTVTRHEYEVDDVKETTKPYTQPMHMTSVDGIYLSSTLYPDRSAATSDAPPILLVTDFAHGPNINNYYPDYPDVPMNYSDDDDRPLANPFLTHFHDPEDTGHRKQKAKSQVFYDQTRATNPPPQWSQFDAPNYDEGGGTGGFDGGGGSGDPAGVSYQREESEEVTISPISFSKFVDSLSPNFHFIPTTNDYEYDVPDELSPGVTYTGRHHHVGNNDGDQHQHDSPPQTFTYNNYYPADQGNSNKNGNTKKKTTKIHFQTVPIEDVDYQQEPQQSDDSGDEKHETTPAVVDEYQHDADSLDLEQQLLLANKNNNHNQNQQQSQERGNNRKEEEESREPIQQPVLIDVEPIVFHQLPDLLAADHGEEDPPEAADQFENHEDPAEPADVIDGNPVDNNNNNALQQENDDRREPNESSPDEELDSFIPKHRPQHETRYTKTSGPQVNENDNMFEYGNHFSYDDESADDVQNPDDEQQHHQKRPDVDFFDPDQTDEKIFAASFKDYEENTDGIQRRKTYFFSFEDDFNNFFPVSSKKRKKKKSTKVNLIPKEGQEKKEKVIAESVTTSAKVNQTKYRNPVSSLNTDVKAFLYSRNYDAHPDLLRKEIPSFSFPDSMEIKDHAFSAGMEPATTAKSSGERDIVPLVTHAVPDSTITTQQAYHKLKNNMMNNPVSLNRSLEQGSTSARKGKSIMLRRTPDPSVRREQNHRIIMHDSIGSQLKELRRQEKEEMQAKKRKEMEKTTRKPDYPFQYTYITRKPVTTLPASKAAINNRSKQRNKSQEIVSSKMPHKHNNKTVRRNDDNTKVKTKSKLQPVLKEPVPVDIPESRFFDSFLTGIGNKSVRKETPKPIIRSKSNSRNPLRERYQYYLPVKKHTKQANVIVKQPPRPYLYTVDEDDISSILLQQQEQEEATTSSPLSVTFRLPSPFDGFVTDFEPLLEKAKASTRRTSFSSFPAPKPTMPSPVFDEANFTQVRKVIELPRTRKEDSFYSIKRLDKSESSDWSSKDSHGDDGATTKHPDPFPYQYNIEIRKRKKQVSIVNNKVPGPRGPVHYQAEATGHGQNDSDKGKGGLREGREKHVDRDLEVNKYRMVENKEEEHWHEKKWHKEDLKEEYVDGKPVPVKVHIHPKYIGQGVKEKQSAKDSHLPFYARPLDAYASKEEIHKHFSVPSPGFRVDKAFETWVKKDVE